MKKYAVIDIGTNSIRLLLAAIKEGKITERKKFINTTRIGGSVDKNKVISKEGIIRNVEAFHNFVQKAKEYGAEEVRAIATSAVREAKNKEEFIQMVYHKTGVNIKTISGEEEAELGYKGVVMGMECHFLAGGAIPAVSGHSILVIDIGGGSTELVLGGHGDIKFNLPECVNTPFVTGSIKSGLDKSSTLKTISLDIGAVRMTKGFVTTDPISKEEHGKMEREIYKIVRDKVMGDRGDCPHGFLTAVGIGGTITTLAALHQKLDPYDPEKVHNYRLTLEDINNLKEKLLSLTVRQIKQLKGIHPKRADIIIAGITILSVIMDSLNLKEIIISEYDNLEGLLYDSL